MTAVITNLCLRDAACVKVCPVDCIVPGNPVDQYPIYYIDSQVCIDCGACIPECPHGAIFFAEKLPSAYKSKKAARLSFPVGTPGCTEVYDSINDNEKPVHLEATRSLQPGEVIDLKPCKAMNKEFFSKGPGYDSVNLDYNEQ